MVVGRFTVPYTRPENQRRQSRGTRGVQGCKLGRAGILKPEATMDTAKLIIGQDVFLSSGIYYAEGKIVQTSAEGARVLLRRDPLTGKNNVVWEFDSKGEALNCMGTAEYGSFTIDDMPFEERRAEL